MLKDQLWAFAVLLPFLVAPAPEKPVEKPPEKKPVVIAPVKALTPAKVEPKPVQFGSDIAIGHGPLIQPDQLVEIHLVVADSGGKELINTRKRGLSIIVAAKPDGIGYLDRLLKGMHQGGVRKATLLPADLNEGRGLPPFVPAGIETQVTVWVVRTIKPNR